MRLARKAVAAGSLVILAGAITASAWCAGGYSFSGDRWRDGDIPVSYYIYTGLSPPGSITMKTYVDAAKAAFQKWEDVPSSYMAFNCRGETAAYAPNLDVSDGRNAVGWTNANLGSALAVNVYWVWGNYMVEFDIAVDKNKGWSAATPTPFMSYDLHTALLHEAGHTLCLDDVYDARYSDQVMYYAISSGEMKRELGDGDKAGITFIYPKKGDLTVSEVSGPSSALEYESIELSATIRNAGGSVTNSCRLEFYLSLDSTIDARDTFLGEDVIPSLNVSQEYGANILITLPEVASERNYYVFAVADAQSEIQELSEENNTDFYFPLKVWLDKDADGLPNWWENEMSLDAYDATGQNGSEGDPDGEGLINSEEYRRGTNPLLADTDGDGQSDREEIVAGTDPTDNRSLFRVVLVSIDGDGSDRWVRIAWSTVLGKKYQVYYQDRLGVPWIGLGPVHSGNGGLMFLNDTEGLTLPGRYYRIGVE